MPGLIDRARMAIARRIAPARRPDDRPPGGFTFGTSWFGGPTYTDAFQSRRAPTPWDLVERYRSLVFALIARNRDAVTRIPLRLYADGSRVQGKPGRACDAIKVSRSIGRRMVRANLVSPSAVDQVYEVRNHPILDVLDNSDGGHFFSRRALLGLMVSSMDLLGSAYLVPGGNGWDWEKGRLGSGPPERLWVVYAQYVIPIRDAGDPLVKWWQYFRDRLPVENTLWFRQSISIRDPYGSAYSPTYAGDMYADQEQRMVAIADQLLGQGPRPNLVASAKDPMMPPGEPERKRFEQDLNRRQAGGNAGGVIVSSGSYEFTPINQPPADSSWRDLSEYDRDCLASLFGVPPTYFTTDTNLANLQAADEQHSRMAVEPRCCTISETLTDLVRRWDPRLFFKFDPSIQEDDEAREKVISMQLASGRLTINEANEEDRWDKKPWGNEPWLPGTMKQPTMMQAEHEMGLEQGKAAIEQGDAAIEQGDKSLEHDGKRVEIEKKKAQQKPASAEKRNMPQLSWGQYRPPPVRKEGESLEDFHRRFEEYARAARIADRFHEEMGADDMKQALWDRLEKLRGEMMGDVA